MQRLTRTVFLSFAPVLLAAAGFAQSSGQRLLEAAKAGDGALAQSLLAQNASAAAAEPDGTTALHWAARYNDVELAKRLLDAGAKVDAANRYGITPLYLAAQNGSAEMIEALLDAGADASAAVEFHETALMTVARTGSVEAARVLLDHGAGIAATEEWHGQTALMWAVSENHPEMTAFLVERGANVNAISDINEWERQNTAEPRAKWLPAGGLTPLLFAARDGCQKCAEVLAGAGADIQVQDPLGVSAVVMAIINGHYDVAGYLLDQGADPNLADETGRTALFSAVDFNTMPQSNRPPPDVVQENLSALDLVKKLIAKGADINVQLLRQQPYRAKLDRGDDTMFTTGTTPLLRAAKAADLDAMRVLLDAGAEVDLPTRAGITPLMAAAGVGTKEEDTTGRFKTEDDAIAAIQMLLDHGADINAATGGGGGRGGGNRGGETSLHAAAKWGLDKVVQYLVDNGARLDAKTGQGFTPLDAALGLAGGSGGFDGSRRDVHESTAKLIRELMAERGIPIESAALPE